MKRILILLASLLVVGPALAFYETNGRVLDEQERKHYVTYKCFYDQFWCALAISEDGAFGTSTKNHPESAKYNALLQCRMIASKPETCEIVDVNAESDFIKGGDEPIDTLFPAAPSPLAPTLKERLLDLRSLVDEGLITEEDYVQAKKQILDGM